MKKVFLLGSIVLFALAVLTTSCKDDDDKKCTTCTDDGVEYEVCWKEGNQIDALAKVLDFMTEHPNAICEDPDTY